MKAATLPLFPATIIPPPLEPEPPLTPQERRRKYDTPRGYAFPPGSGPAGETCRTCTHSRLVYHNDRRYWKCGLVPVTRGPGTDIRLKTAACAKWEQHRDFHAGDRVQILPTKDKGPKTKDRSAVIRGPSASPDYVEVTLRHGRREKHLHLPISRLRFLRSAK